MSNLSYRVYSSFKGWKLIGIKQELSQVVDLLESSIQKETNARYLIIEHDSIQDMDIPYKNICGIEDFLIFKEEFLNVSRRAEKIYRRKKS